LLSSGEATEGALMVEEARTFVKGA
jgi:hypothetical protein